MDEQTKEKLTELWQEREYYRRQCIELQAACAAAREQNALLSRQAEEAQRRCSAIENAFWWRVTKPIRALTDLLRGPQAAQEPPKPTESVVETELGRYRREHTPADEPLVSILIPNRDHMEDLSECIESVFALSRYRNFEIIVAENGSFTDGIFRYYENIQRQHDNVRVVTWDGPFNYSAINNFAAREARGEYFLLLNNDTEVISPGWLEEMLLFARRADVGVVGAMLYYPDNTIQHAGMSVTKEIPNLHLGRFEPRQSPGTVSELYCPRDADAVTGACMMLRRSVWEELGGLDETFEVAFNDVDLCMRARAKGYRCVFTPHAELYHKECRSRGLDDTPVRQLRYDNETRRFRIRWLT